MIIVSRRVLLADGLRPAAIDVRDGRIHAIGEWTAGAPGADGLDILDGGDAIVMPGVVDSHVHVNEPGRTDWEGFASATRAAAAGGVTTIVDMPLNSVPPTTTVAGLEAKRRAAEGARVHVEYWGGVVPGNAAEIEPLARAGVRGFKCFLTPSGVDEFENVGERDLVETMPIIAKLGLPLLVHAEWPDGLRPPHGPPRSYATWLNSRPAASEIEAIARVIALARRFGTRVHIVHLAAPAALPMLEDARAAGVPITVETCPHYLTFAAEEIPDGATAFKAAPPIRTRADREGLWQGLIDGTIDLIATDHSPAPASLKHVDDGDLLAAWGGIASLQLGLAAVWTGASARRVPIERVADWMCAAPARLAGLGDRKGRIAVGYDADLIVFEPDAEWTVEGAQLRHRHPLTPYEGMSLRGKVTAPIVGGRIVGRADP